MRDRKSIASVLIYVGSALCFFLPFVTVSCAGMKIGTFTGQQLATGVHPSESVPGVSVNTQGYNGDPLAAVAFLCAIAGVGLSLAGRKLAAVTSASGGVGTIALLMMKSRLTDQIQAQIGGQNAGIVQVNVEPGLMFAVSLLAAGAALNLYVLFHREENAAAIAGAGDVYGTVNSGPPGWKAASEPQTPTEVQAQVGVATRVSRFCRRCGTPVRTASDSARNADWRSLKGKKLQNQQMSCRTKHQHPSLPLSPRRRCRLLPPLRLLPKRLRCHFSHPQQSRSTQ